MNNVRRALFLAALGCVLFGGPGRSEELDPFRHLTGLTDLEQTFNATFDALPTSQPCVVEFYASWCPHCRHFAPTYHLVALAFSNQSLTRVAAGNVSHGAVEAAPATMMVARIDCAKEPGTCAQYDIPSYPHITLGSAKAYSQRLVQDIKVFNGQGSREAVAIIQWIGREFGMNVTEVLVQLVKLQHQDSPLLHISPGGAPPLAAHPSQLPGIQPLWTQSDVESSTLFLYTSIMSNPLLHRGEARRQALLHIISLWAAAHPSSRCKAGALALQESYHHWWPLALQAAPDRVKQYQICGPAAAASTWLSCKGSTPSSRGYTCGLWLMFHTCVNRLPNTQDSGLLFMTALHAFNQYFFQCQVCQGHFAQLLNSSEAVEVMSRREAVLWIWRAHNEVNARLIKYEQEHGRSSSGDPLVPKALFPGAQACPECRGQQPLAAAGAAAAAGSGGELQWDLDQVYMYLDRVYGSGSSSTPPGQHHEGQEASADSNHRLWASSLRSRLQQQQQQLSSSWTYLGLMTGIGLLAAAALLMLALSKRRCMHAAANTSSLLPRYRCE